MQYKNHRWVWEKKYGKIPKGYEIHHIDGNKRNNSIDNLELLTPKEHSAKHKHHAWNKGKKGLQNHTEETKKKISLTMKERGISPPARKGYIISDEHKRKISEANKGRKLSLKFREDKSKKMKELWKDKNYKEMMLNKRECK